MKHRSIAKSALFGAITFALTQSALAVTDEEFNELKEKFNQLADQVDENSQSVAAIPRLAVMVSCITTI